VRLARQRARGIGQRVRTGGAPRRRPARSRPARPATTGATARARGRWCTVGRPRRGRPRRQRSRRRRSRRSRRHRTPLRRSPLRRSPWHRSWQRRSPLRRPPLRRSWPHRSPLHRCPWHRSTPHPPPAASTTAASTTAASTRPPSDPPQAASATSADDHRSQVPMRIMAADVPTLGTAGQAHPLGPRRRRAALPSSRATARRWPDTGRGRWPRAGWRRPVGDDRPSADRTGWPGPRPTAARARDDRRRRRGDPPSTEGSCAAGRSSGWW
jgi:hypothetical protein